MTEERGMEMSCDRGEVWRCHVTEKRGMELSCDSGERYGYVM